MTEKAETERTDDAAFGGEAADHIGSATELETEEQAAEEGEAEEGAAGEDTTPPEPDPEDPPAAS